MRRSLVVNFLAVSVLGIGVAAVAAGPVTTAPTASTQSTGSTAAGAATDHDWQLATSTYAPAGEDGYVPTYVGNGYLAARIPAEGTGFSSVPVSTESQLAGFYGQGPGTTVQRANLPAWSTLGYSDGSGTFGNTQTEGCRAGTLCEAEAGTFTGSAKKATDHTGYTGSGFAAGFAASGNVPQRGSSDAVDITDASAGSAILAVRYAAGANASTQTLSVSVNGAAGATLTMPATSTWNTWAVATVPIATKAGTNTIALTCGQSDTCVANIDSLNLAPKPCVYGQFCEAESGTLSGSAKLVTNHTGFTGTGFVGGFAANGNTPQRGTSDTLHFTGARSGSAVVSVRYAAAVDTSTQTLTATVNGADPQTVPMPATGTWDTWKTVTVPVHVNAGDNTVALTCAASDTCVLNVDAVAVSAEPLTASDGQVSDYSQTLDLHNGLLTTKLTWTSPAGNKTELTFSVFVSEAQTHMAAVRVTARPVGWSGPATFIDLLDGRADTLPASHRTSAPINLTAISDRSHDGATHLISEKASTLVLGMTAGIASTLTTGGDTSPTTAMADAPVDSIGQASSIDMTDGDTYTVTKYVGVASGTDTADGSAPLAVATTDPVDAAAAASRAAAATGWNSLLKAHEAAWATLWKSDITVPGDSALTLKARASMYYLLGSIRDGVDWSLSPGGLSSAEYNGHVFWDAETWMYPALLAAHPDLASGMNDYRSSLLGAAEQTASGNGLQGAQFPWESAQNGSDVGIHPREIHITGDIALAQWDYYQATGDLGWLRTKGWPLLQKVAQFYVSRSTADGHGGYDLNGVEGPDENHNNVNNSADVNVSAITSLQIATKAAGLLGKTADPTWDQVARGLAASIPFDPVTNTHPEYDGYSGQTVNQADVTLLQYPWQYPMDKTVAQADLDYYTPRTALSGPAMTDAINMIDTAALSTPGCSAYTYFQRSVDPYNVGPFDQYSEHLGATGVIDFTTGIGGFLQELYYGFTGMRWGTDSLSLDPMLPPQLPGLKLTGLQWQGRTFDVDIEPDHTTVTLDSGPAMPVTVAGAKKTVSSGSPVTVATRRPDRTPTSDVARCASVDASSADVSYPATAAVDGSDATTWKPTAAGATLTIDLGAEQPVRHVAVLSGTTSTSAYSIETSANGTDWTTLGTVGSSADPRSTIDAGAPPQARYVRYRAADGVTPSVSSLTVVTGLPGAPTGVHAGDIAAATTVVSWTAPADTGDGPITGYRVTPYKNGKPQAPVTVAGTTAQIKDLIAGAGYSFTVSAINDLGDGPESERSNVVRWERVDGTAPRVTLSTDPSVANGSHGWFVAPVTVVARATDDRSVASTEISVDGGPWTAGNAADAALVRAEAATTSSASVVVAGDGTHTIRARATDASGNISATASLRARVDTTAPTVAAALNLKDRTLALNGTDTTSGVLRVEYRSGRSGPWRSYSSALHLGSRAELVQYRAVDNAGNIGRSRAARVPAQAASSQASGTATTGADVGLFTWLALAAISAGAALTLFARRRRTPWLGAHRA